MTICSYTETDAANVVASILRALQHCHALGIVHRDLKPENLLYASKSDECGVKIADFGLAKLQAHAAESMKTACGKSCDMASNFEGVHFTWNCIGVSSCFSQIDACIIWNPLQLGTPGYVAPEVLFRIGYTKAVDLWSTGVITYILLCGFPPFYEENNAALFSAIKAAAFDYPAEFWDQV